MSPLILVGILVIISSTQADVKHVLEGSAQPPEQNAISPQAVNHLASNSPNGQFWWMNSNSPLKAAYDYYKKCHTKGNCITPVSPNVPVPQPFLPQENVNIDVNKNPFFNGNFQSSNGNANFNKENNNKIDINKNPFLSGSVVTTGNGTPVIKDQSGFLGVQPAQPFKKPSFSTTHPLDDHKKKPGFATSHPLQHKKASFGLLNITVECNGDGFMCVEKSLCINGIVNTNGEGLLQVRSDVRFCHEDTEICCRVNNQNEITAGKSSVPESTIKFAGGAGFSPGLIHVQPLNVKPDIIFAGEHGHHSGASTSKSIRDTSLSPNSVFGSTVDYSNTKFSDDVRFASTFQGPAYLPPVGPTTPQPRPFETRQPGQQYVPSRPSTSTYVQPSITTPRPSPSSTFRPAPSPTYRPAPSTSFRPAPSQTFRPAPSPTFRPAPSPTFKPAPSPTFRPAPSPTFRPVPSPTFRPAPSTTFRPAPSVTFRPAPSTTFKPAPTTSREYLPPRSSTPRPTATVTQYVPPQQPYRPSVTPQQPYRPSVTPQQPYRPSVTPQQPYKPSITPQQPYQPSVTPQNPYRPSTQQSYQPSITPQRPYQPSVTPQQPYQPSVTPQQPYQPSVTTQRPYKPTQKPYQPSIKPQQPYQPSVTQRPYQPQPTSPPYQPPSSTFRPYQPSQQPYQPSTSRPTTSREYLPPRTSTSFVPQPSNPRPTPFVPIQTPTPTSYQPQPRPSPSSSFPQPRPTFPQQYPTSNIPQTRPTPSPYRPSISYPSSQPGIIQTRPTSPPVRPTSPPFRPTASIPQFPSFPQPKPTTPSVTNGYQYPSPSSPRPNPFIPQQSTPLRPGPSITNPSYVSTSTYTQPSTTSRPFVPQQTTVAPNPAGGYEYPKPTPTFGYPSTTPRQDFSNSNINNQFVRPPKKPSENPDQNYEAANVDGAFVRPTTARTQFQGELNTAPPPGCAAALKCVQEIYCTAEGVISPVPVVLTKEQELSRVPTTECQDTESGIIGKCCRDPNYKDPWPSANLVNGVDDGQYKEDDNIGQYQQDLQRNVRSDKGGPKQNFGNNKNANVQLPPQPTCGERHLDTSPLAPGPLDVNFAEIPWQAMILRDSNRSLLCGGVIIQRNAVLTAAHCIDGIETSDILIKGGEWKLGIDEEPLPFQIVSVAAAIRHPQYQRGSLVNDLALLILEEKLRPSKNVGTLCLPPPNQIPTQNCIATGWGKKILQLHAKGAIMHAINVKIMDNQQCQETLNSEFQHASSNYSPNTLCGYSNIDQCRVDYGSALACSEGNNYVLSGIYAWDTGCKRKGQIGGYIAPDVEWIQTTLAKPLRELRKLDEQN